jgi:hypothetical protein
MFFIALISTSVRRVEVHKFRLIAVLIAASLSIELAAACIFKRITTGTI